MWAVEPRELMLRTGTVFSFGPWRDVKIRLPGRYQVRNACTALTVIERLRSHGFTITDEQVRAGMEKTVWPGRAELLQLEPTVIVDGAHNPQGFEAFMETLELLFPGRKLNIVLGVLADKDFNAGIDIVLPHAKKFFAVTPPSYRALDAGELAADIRQKTSVPAVSFESITAAIEAALAESEKDDVIAIMGSLYQVGTVRSYFGRTTFGQNTFSSDFN